MHLAVISKALFAHGKKAWYLNHINDQHVRKAQAQGFRSRASFKLLQIEEKFSIVKGKSTALDLGSAPGSWSQALKSIEPQMKVVAVDLLPMKEVQGVDFYNIDARNPSFHRLLRQKYGLFDVIVSDMAPNFSGTLFQTHQETMQLNKCCLGLSLIQGSLNCSLVMKTIQGDHQKILAWVLQYFYQRVTRFKPKSSRSQSTQHYLICQKKKKVRDIASLFQKLNSLQFDKIKTKGDIKSLIDIKID